MQSDHLRTKFEQKSVITFNSTR